eukprot:jgi/Mesen1/7028/ME000366S06238
MALIIGLAVLLTSLVAAIFMAPEPLVILFPGSGNRMLAGMSYKDRNTGKPYEKSSGSPYDEDIAGAKGKLPFVPSLAGGRGREEDSEPHLAATEEMTAAAQSVLAAIRAAQEAALAGKEDARQAQGMRAWHEGEASGQQDPALREWSSQLVDDAKYGSPERELAELKLAHGKGTQLLEPAEGALFDVSGAARGEVAAAGHTVAGAAARAGHSAVEGLQRAGHSVAEGAQRAKERVEGAATRAEEYVAEGVHRVGTTVADTAAKTRDAAVHVGRAVRDAPVRAGQAVVGTAQRAGHATYEATAHVAQAAKDRVVGAERAAVRTAEEAWERVADAARAAEESIERAANLMPGKVRGAGGRVVGLEEAARRRAGDAAHATWDGARQTADTAHENVRGAARGVGHAAGEAARGVGRGLYAEEEAVRRGIAGAGHRAWDDAVWAEEAARHGVGRAGERVWEKMKGRSEEVREAAGGAAHKAWEKAGEVGEAAEDRAASAGRVAWETAGDAEEALEEKLVRLGYKARDGAAGAVAGAAAGARAGVGRAADIAGGWKQGQGGGAGPSTRDSRIYRLLDSISEAAATHAAAQFAAQNPHIGTPERREEKLSGLLSLLRGESSGAAGKGQGLGLGLGEDEEGEGEGLLTRGRAGEKRSKFHGPHDADFEGMQRPDHFEWRYLWLSALRLVHLASFAAAYGTAIWTVLVLPHALHKLWRARFQLVAPVSPSLLPPSPQEAVSGLAQPLVRNLLQASYWLLGPSLVLCVATFARIHPPWRAGDSEAWHVAPLVVALAAAAANSFGLYPWHLKALEEKEGFDVDGEPVPSVAATTPGASPEKMSPSEVQDAVDQDPAAPGSRAGGRGGRKSRIRQGRIFKRLQLADLEAHAKKLRQAARLAEYITLGALSWHLWHLSCHLVL